MITNTAAKRGGFFKFPMMEKLWLGRKCAVVALLAMAFLSGHATAAGVGSEVRQLIVSVAPGWDSTTGRLQCFERSGEGWKPVTAAWPVLYGKNGLVWGRGVLGTDEPGRHK